MALISLLVRNSLNDYNYQCLPLLRIIPRVLSGIVYPIIGTIMELERLGGEADTVNSSFALDGSRSVLKRGQKRTAMEDGEQVEKG